MNINYIRYADDFIITGKPKGILQKEVKPVVEKFMVTRGLQLSDEKMTITHISDGFDFLEQNIRKYDGVLLIMPSNKNVKSFLRNIETVRDDNKIETTYSLIKLRNPKIRGWLITTRHIVAKQCYSKVDHQIWTWIWNWCKRRHPHICGSAPRRARR